MTYGASCASDRSAPAGTARRRAGRRRQASPPLGRRRPPRRVASQRPPKPLTAAAPSGHRRPGEEPPPPRATVAVRRARRPHRARPVAARAAGRRVGCRPAGVRPGRRHQDGASAGGSTPAARAAPTSDGSAAPGPAPGRVSAATAPISAEERRCRRMPTSGARSAQMPISAAKPARSTAGADQQGGLVVHAEHVDGELLQRLGHEVDDDSTDRDQRRRPGAGQYGDQFGRTDRDRGGGDPGQCAVPALLRAHPPSVARSARPTGSDGDGRKHNQGRFARIGG